MKGKVQTVCGLVEPATLGKTLTHEHLFMDFTDVFVPAKPEDKALETADFTMPNLGWIRQNPYSHKKNLQLNSPEVMAAVMQEMEQYKKYGGGTIVENTSFGIQRNVNFMHDISVKHGVNIIAGAGYYVMIAQKKETIDLSVEDMAKSITLELTSGCEDAPHIKCGFIGEVGCSFPLNAFERKSIQASGETQESLGCPVMIHPGRHPDAPEEILRIYTESGGDVKKMVMGHLDRTFNDLGALLEFASHGTFCEYDLFGIETSHYQLETSTDMPSDAQRIQRIKHLVDNGFEDKILISHDIHTVHRLVVGDGTHTVGQALRTTAQEHGMATFSLALADSHAEVDLEAPAHLLDGDTIILEGASETPDPSDESDPRLRVAVVLAASERLLGRRLRCVEEMYGQHLRRLSSITHSEQQVLFDSVEPIITCSDQLVALLDAAVTSWDSETTCLGALFEDDLWERYEEYLQLYEEAVSR